MKKKRYNFIYEQYMLSCHPFARVSACFYDHCGCDFWEGVQGIPLKIGYEGVIHAASFWFLR